MAVGDCFFEVAAGLALVHLDNLVTALFFFKAVAIVVHSSLVYIVANHLANLRGQLFVSVDPKVKATLEEVDWSFSMQIDELSGMGNIGVVLRVELVETQSRQANEQ